MQSYDLWAWFKARVSRSGAPSLDTDTEKFRIEILAEGLESPWAIAFASDRRIFITERPGRLRVFKGGKLNPDPVRGLPEISFKGQGGLLDITLHPDYYHNHLVYLSYTAESQGTNPEEGKKPMTRVARFKDTPEGLKDMEIIFSGFFGSDKNKHFGCRICFGVDGKLYMTLGERGEGKRAQDLTDLNGKTLRLNEDGSIPPDNPFFGVEGVRPEIFSYGHRNAQGMAVQPETGLIFQTEHGPSWNDAPGGGDEINIVEAGKNYGWPLIHHRKKMGGIVTPLLEYTPAIAPAGAMFYRGDIFHNWKNNFFFTTLVGHSLIRLKINHRTVLGQEVLLRGAYGRLRDVAEGPDGFIYLITSDTDAYGTGRAAGDRLIRLVPKK